MGISEMLCSEGIFICDGCRDKIQLNLDDETFEALKTKINTDEKSVRKCFLCSLVKRSDGGLFLPPEMMANALESLIDKQDEMYQKYKDGKINCPGCGKPHELEHKIVNCKCGKHINAKKYGKSLKIPSLKKITFKQYIKFLRGKSNVPGGTNVGQKDC